MATGIKLQHPVPGAKATDPFGWRAAIPGVVAAQLHTGQDYAAGRGTPILAAHSGRVNALWWDKFANGDPAGGNMLQIGSARFSTRYAHLNGYAVRLGDEVRAGQVIGYVGRTGAATGDHLHFELIMPGGAVDPVPYIRASKTSPLLEEEIDMAKGTFVADDPRGSWWYTDGMTRRELAPGENQLLIDLGIVEPVQKPGGVHLVSSGQLARIPVEGRTK